MAKILLVILSFHFTNVLIAIPSDTILMYNSTTQHVKLIPPVDYDTAITFDHTNSFSGLFNSNLITLNTTPPSSNLFSNSLFSDLERAEYFFNVTDYPIRTAIKISRYQHDTLKNKCSGIMVANNFVLTAAHCVSLYGKWVKDSLLVSPAYDNGQPQPHLKSSGVTNYYIFKSFFDQKQWNDIALLELSQPIGNETGWIGIAFNKDTSYFRNKIFHKLSYPAVPSLTNPNRVFNGDTLYYNYGYIDVTNSFMGIRSSQAQGIPGQSGSSFFYTDNTDYYSFGVFSFSNLYRHYPISNWVFYQLKNIMENQSISTNNIKDNKVDVAIFPNPFSEQAILKINHSGHLNHQLVIVDTQGRIVRSYSNIQSQQFIIEKKELTAGLYFFQLRNDSEIISKGKIMIN